MLSWTLLCLLAGAPGPIRRREEAGEECSSSFSRLGELADEIEEERAPGPIQMPSSLARSSFEVPITEVLSKYGRLENHVSATTKATPITFGPFKGPFNGFRSCTPR